MAPRIPDNLRRSTLHVDGTERGVLERGSQLTLAVEPGPRKIEVCSRSSRSNPIVLTAQPGESIVLQCGDPQEMPGDIARAVKGLGYSLLLWPAFDLALAYLARAYALAHPTRSIGRRDPLQTLADALAAFDESLAQGRDDPLAHFHRGMLMAQMGHPETKARECFDRAIQLRPDYAEAHLHRGVTLQSEPEQAMNAYDRALRIDPNLADAHHRRGELLETLGRTEEALTAFDRALELDSALDAVVRRRRELNRALGRPDPFDEHFGALFVEEVRKIQGGYAGLPFKFIQELRGMNRGQMLGTSQEMISHSRDAERHRRLESISPAEFAKAFQRRYVSAAMEAGSSFELDQALWKAVRSAV